MFKVVNSKIVSNISNKEFDTFAMLFDGDGGILLSCGTSDVIAAKHAVLTKAAVDTGIGIQPIMVVFDEITDEICEAINRMYQCTGYAEIWLKENGFIQ